MVWSYTPQQVLTEGLFADVYQARQSLSSAIVGRNTAVVHGSIRTQYALVNTTQVASMLAFVDSCQGPFRAFDMFIEGRTIRVRFDTDVSVELFQPGFGRMAQIGFIQVDS